MVEWTALAERSRRSQCPVSRRRDRDTEEPPGSDLPGSGLTRKGSPPLRDLLLTAATVCYPAARTARSSRN